MWYAVKFYPITDGSFQNDSVAKKWSPLLNGRATRFYFTLVRMVLFYAYANNSESANVTASSKYVPS